MATYRQIQRYVRETAGFMPMTAWIGHVKEQAGLPLRATPNRQGDRLRPCPSDKREPIVAALRHFGILPDGDSR